MHDLLPLTGVNSSYDSAAVPAVRQVLRHPVQRLPRRAAVRRAGRLLHAPRQLRPGKEYVTYGVIFIHTSSLVSLQFGDTHAWTWADDGCARTYVLV
jgi:hypothetical protein